MGRIRDESRNDNDEVKIIKLTKKNVNYIFFIVLPFLVFSVWASLSIWDVNEYLGVIFTLIVTMPLLVISVRKFEHIRDGYKKIAINYGDMTFKVFRTIPIRGVGRRNMTYKLTDISEIKREHDRIRISFHKENLKHSEYQLYVDAVIKTTHLDHTHQEILKIFEDILASNSSSE